MFTFFDSIKKKRAKPLSIKRKKQYVNAGLILVSCVFVLTCIPLVKHLPSFMLWGAILTGVGVFLICKGKGLLEWTSILIVLFTAFPTGFINSYISFNINNKSLIENIETTRAIIVKAKDIENRSKIKRKSVGYEFKDTKDSTYFCFKSLPFKHPIKVGDSVFVAYDSTNPKNSAVFFSREEIDERINSTSLDTYFEEENNLPLLRFILLFLPLFLFLAWKERRDFKRKN